MPKNELEYKSVQANGLNIYYIEMGRGQPLILLHGGSINAEINWNVNLEIFSNYFKCIAVDSRGHGRTENPSKEYSYESMADDIAALITVLHLENPVVCGWSDGGQIALELGIRHLNLVKGLVIGGAVMNNAIQTDFWGSIGINGPGDIDFEKFKTTSPEFHDMLAEAQKYQGKDYWKTLLLDLTKMWFEDTSYPGDKVNLIKNPTLIIQADKDQIIPMSEALGLFNNIDDAELAVIPGSDHSLSMGARAELFTNIVIDFIKRLDGKIEGEVDLKA